jgi:hypothetical protein
MLILTAKDAAREINVVFFDWVRNDFDFDTNLDIKASEAHSYATISASDSIFKISPDAGANFYSIPTDVFNGYDLGAFSAGQRKVYILRLRLPPLAPLTFARPITEYLYLSTGV